MQKFDLSVEERRVLARSTAEMIAQTVANHGDGSDVDVDETLRMIRRLRDLVTSLPSRPKDATQAEAA